MADIDEEALFRGGTNDEENAQEGPPLGRSTRNPWVEGVLRTKAVLAVLCMASMLVSMMVSTHAFNARGATEFSMHLAGYEGLLNNDSTLSHTVSPVFSLKVHAENPRRVLQPWCYSGGEVTVSYSDVVLSWGHVPRFCVTKRRAPIELTLVPLGREVGLSEDLRGRLASDWHKGTAQITVGMKLFCEDQNSFPSRKKLGPSLHSFQLML